MSTSSHPNADWENQQFYNNKLFSVTSNSVFVEVNRIILKVSSKETISGFLKTFAANILWKWWTDVLTVFDDFSGPQRVELQCGSPGLVVMGDDSCSKGCGFKSWRRILDGHDFFSHWFFCKNCIICLKRTKLNKKRPGLAFLKKTLALHSRQWF